jgi:hypothetical protein
MLRCITSNIAQAYLEAGLADAALLSKAESTLDEVLKIEASPKVAKLKLRLLIKRNAGETEIQNCKKGVQTKVKSRGLTMPIQA